MMIMVVMKKVVLFDLLLAMEPTTSFAVLDDVRPSLRTRVTHGRLQSSQQSNVLNHRHIIR